MSPLSQLVSELRHSTNDFCHIHLTKKHPTACSKHVIGYIFHTRERGGKFSRFTSQAFISVVIATVAMINEGLMRWKAYRIVLSGRVDAREACFCYCSAQHAAIRISSRSS